MSTRPLHTSRLPLMLWLLVAASVTGLGVACNAAELKPASVTPDGESAEGPVEGEDDPGKAPPLDGGRGSDAAAAPLPMSRDVTIQVQPGDSGAALLATIKAAKTSVHMTMYLLTNDDIIKALIALHQAGKDVKVVLNKTFPANGGDNLPAYNALKAKGVAVVWAPSAYTFTHAKTVIIDSAKMIVMTMNMTYSSANTNREYIATDGDADDVEVAEKLFEADFTNKAVKVESKLVVSPTNATAVEPRERLKALIDSAKTSLDVEVQTLSDGTIVDAIILAHEAKVDVHVVIDGDTSDSSAQVAAIEKLKQHGVPLRSLKNPDLHAKVIVADGARAFVGSQNMTATALTQNREIGVMTDAPAEAAKVREVISGDFAKGAAL